MTKALAFALVAVLGFGVCKLENSNTNNKDLVSHFSLTSSNIFKSRNEW